MLLFHLLLCVYIQYCHRVTEWLRLEGTCGDRLVQSRCSSRVGPRCPGWNMRKNRWRLHNLSGRPVANFNLISTLCQDAFLNPQYHSHVVWSVLNRLTFLIFPFSCKSKERTASRIERHNLDFLTCPGPVKAFNKVSTVLFTEKVILWDTSLVCLWFSAAPSVLLSLQMLEKVEFMFVHYPEVLAASDSVKTKGMECWDALDTLR